MGVSDSAVTLTRVPRKGAVPFGILLAILLAAMAPSRPAFAEKPAPPAIPGLQKNAEKPDAEHPDDPMGRSAPHGTVLGFIKAAERDDLDRAAEYLDAQLIPKRARKLAQDMAAVLDAADLQDLARNPEGDLEDGLPPGRERIGVVKTVSGSHEILLERVQRGKEPPIWLFSGETLKWVPRVRGEIGVSPVERLLSGTFLDTRILGYPIWRLIGMILVVPISFLIARLATGLLLSVIPALVRRMAKQPVDYPAAKLKWPVLLLIMAILFYVISLVAFTAASRVFWGSVAVTVATIAFTWMGLRLIDDVGNLIGGGPRPRIGSGGIAMARLLTRLSKALLVLFGVIFLFSVAGINLTALLAGVGIGGIALALAAQKSLENFFGVLTILSDKPFRVGDACKVGDITGTVEDIGMRSTRIRTADRTVVSVPNGQLITMNLENFSTREKFLFKHRIQLGYETSAEQLRAVLAEIRAALSGNPKVEARTAHANLSAFRDTSIEIEIIAYLLEASHDAFLVLQEELLLRIMEIVRECGARFAFPPPARLLSQAGSANP